MKLTGEQRNIFIDWAERYLIPIYSINRKIDTSHIRKAFMNVYSKGFYIDDHTVNLILSEIGYRHNKDFSEDCLNWNISSKSLALRLWHYMDLNQRSDQKFFG